MTEEPAAQRLARPRGPAIDAPEGDAFPLFLRQSRLDKVPQSTTSDATREPTTPLKDFSPLQQQLQREESIAFIAEEAEEKAPEPCDPAADRWRAPCCASGDQAWTRLADGLWYRGELMDGRVPHGRGVLHWLPSNTHYEGHFLRGEMVGAGVATDTSGNMCKADFSQSSTCSGYVEYEGVDGYSFSGKLQDGRRHGPGSELLSGGACYDGQFALGLPDGFGRFSSGGHIYEGQFGGGSMHGHGTLRSKSSLEFVARWQDGQAESNKWLLEGETTASSSRRPSSSTQQRLLDLAVAGLYLALVLCALACVGACWPTGMRPRASVPGRALRLLGIPAVQWTSGAVAAAVVKGIAARCFAQKATL